MYGFSKFKVALVAFIAIFVFMIAVMYTTTKDESKIIQNQKKKIEQEVLEKQNSQEFQSQENINVGEQKFDSIRADLDNLTRRVDNIQNSSANLKCRIQGVYVNGQIEQLSSEASLQEAKINGDELVLICSF